MSKRYICQGDIFRYINDELNISQKSLCIVIDKVRSGNMVESRISEVKRGKRKGYRELENAEELFFEECFTIKDEELGFQKVLNFVLREGLVFQGSEGEENDDYRSYSLRMLKYGLENYELPLSKKNLIYDSFSEPAANKIEIEEEKAESCDELTGSAAAVNIKADSDLIQAVDDRAEEGWDLSLLEQSINKIRKNWVYIFLCLISLFFIPLFFDIFQVSAIDIFLWMNNLSPFVFFSMILILAVSTLLFGLVDTALAIFLYKQDHKAEEKLNYYEIYLIAKYGDKHRIIESKGRYDLALSRVCYSVFCNITGAFASLALYSFLRTLKDFSGFVRAKHFDIMADIGLIFTLILVFINSFLLFTRKPMKEFCEKEENPDTLRADRLNVIANNLHIIVNIFFTYLGIVLTMIYGFSNYPEKNKMSPLFILVVIGFYLYLWFASSSPYAVDFNAQCTGAFVLLAPFVAVLTSVYTIMCFYPSLNYFISIGVNFIGMLMWLACLFSKGGKNLWPVERSHKMYFALYAGLMLLFYVLSVFIQM